MKITLSTNGNTIVIDNKGDLSNDKMRRILDILIEAPQNPNVSAVRVGSAASNLGKWDIPADTKLYKQWLAQSSWDTASTALSDFVSYDIRRGISTVYYVIRKEPQFATKLGLPRFLATCKWLYANDRLSYLPSEESLAKYYSKAVRSSQV